MCRRRPRPRIAAITITGTATAAATMDTRITRSWSWIHHHIHAAQPAQARNTSRSKAIPHRGRLPGGLGSPSSGAPLTNRPKATAPCSRPSSSCLSNLVCATAHIPFHARLFTRSRRRAEGRSAATVERSACGQSPRDREGRPDCDNAAQLANERGRRRWSERSYGSWLARATQASWQPVVSKLQVSPGEVASWNQ